ncbi:calycin-like domain-containing protein [Dysgonomonas sp. 511]|uniref:calycin-like domain-containing protein n=1 Tax=Dysgonomonas sp. 511 TaxID=2302930 RepID=UPI0013D14ECF|nr:calycin-like domain-containing protein [Dysgonomonas sp. 511]NDV78965.1 hypothetical protein [Dysgonomonas sp. 511]
MKLKLSMIMMAVILFMAACSSDDDDLATNIAQDVAGTYKGYTVADFQYTSIPMTTPDQSISITANEDGTSNIFYESDTWGKFTILNATVSLKNNVYTISGSGKTVMAMGSADPKEYDCSIEGTISKDKQTVSFFFDIPVPMGGIEITFTQGDAPANMVIAKVYTGSLNMTVMGSDQGTTDDVKVTIKAQDNGKSEVTLGKFGEGAMGFTEDIVITDVEISLENGVYTIKKEGISAPSSTANGPITVTGSMEGTIEDNNANIVFTLRPGSMPMDLVCTFIGSSN